MVSILTITKKSAVVLSRSGEDNAEADVEKYDEDIVTVHVLGLSLTGNNVINVEFSKLIDNKDDISLSQH